MMNVLFGDKRSYDDWGLLMEQMKISFPDPKTKTVDLPGADGGLDLTEINGPVKYDNREIEFIFSREAEYESWHNLVSRIASVLHGKRLRVILDTDPNYFYIGRFELNAEKTDDVLTKISITGNVDPYKYDLEDGTEDWLWDLLDLEEGIIREYGNIPINGSGTITVVGRDKYTEPVITCSTPMVLTCGLITVNLPAGTTKVYELLLGPGDHDLVFTGNGTVTVSYRGGVL